MSGLSKFNTRVVLAEVSAPKMPEHCEIPGCKSIFIPGSNGFPDRHERGHADVVVNDFGGIKRGICGEHYIRGLVRAGKHPSQALMAPDGSISPVLVKEHWDKLDAEAAA
jgi:hypothetical protein